MSEGPCILPTHTCFDDALDYLAFRLKLRPDDEQLLVLVHAICLAPEGPHAGEPFAHAWVEEGDRVWQDGFLNGARVTYSCERASYEAAMRLQLVRRYIPRQAAAENHRTGTYGPWAPELAAMCGAGRVFRPA